MNRWRPLTWILLSVACFIAAFYFWRLGDQWREEKIKSRTPEVHVPPRGSARTVTVTVTHASPAPVLPKALTPPPFVTNSTATAATNVSRLAYRLSNTTQSIGQLARNPNAVLLENALIDSSKPLDLAIPDELRSHGDPGSYIVQSRGPLNDAFRAALKTAGAQIVSYIPNNAYLVTAPFSALAQVRSLPQTQSVLPYEPYYKLKSSLLNAVMQGQNTPDSLNIGVFPGQAEPTIAALTKLGAKVVSQSASPFGAELFVQNARDAAAVARLSGVQLVEPHAQRMSANDLTRVLVGVATDTITSTNYRGLSGTNVLVSVTDTWWPTNGATIFNPDLMNILSPFTGVNDFEGHATHVGGIIAGSGNNSPTNVPGSVFGANFRGKAPLANLWALPINYPPMTDEELQESIASTNALISNNSWGYVGVSDYNLAASSYDQAVRDSLPGVTGSQPVLYVFAAGNSGGGVDNGTGGTADTVSSPGVAKNIITVGATELPRNITNDVTSCDSCGGGCTTNKPWQGMTDSPDEVASFSSRGNVGIGVEGEFGRFKPDVVAPGTMVVSTRSLTWDTNSYYNPSSGFSFGFSGDQVAPGQLFNYSVFIPCNAVRLGIAATSTDPLNAVLPIYVQANNFPTTANFLGNNSVSLPPDAPLTPTDTTWFYSVGNSTNVTITYDITTTVVTTNDFGTYFDVLRGMNDSLTSSNGVALYRYESGTSMAAPAVSGTLALIEDYFTNTLSYRPSPALLKAMVINGARSANPIYDFQVQSTINYQGWGMVNLTNSLPMGLSSSFGQAVPMLYLDQDPTNALATGDSRTFTVSVDPSAQSQPLRITLVWTDPPGNPAASIKLVNNLDLVVTNLDSVSSPDGTMIYFGNDILAGNTFNLPWDTNAAPVPNADVVNNVENVYIAPPLGSNYTITVAARNVNVNAVTANTNGVVQDFALVVSSGNGSVSNALTLTAGAIVSDSTPNVTQVSDMFTNSTTVSGGILLNQHVGASSPLQGTNTLSLTGVSQNDWGTNGQITLGVTNQWHFYVVTNTGASSDFTNAVFATFLPPNLSETPGSANAGALTNATRYEADIDLYVSRDPGLTNLNPVAVAAADKSLLRGGTEFIIYSNSAPGTVYYVGVKSEDQQAAEYGFLGLFSNEPFGARGPNGELTIRGINVPQAIPDGSPTRPGISYTFAIAPEPIEVRRVVVTNTLSHENFGDLFGVLSHNRKTSMLNNHTFGNGNYTQTFIYEDNGEGDIIGSQPTDPPGTLRNFIGEQGLGLWILWEVDNAVNHTGQVDDVRIRLDPQSDSSGNFITNTIAGNSWFYDFIDVPPEATNMTINVNIQSGPGPVDLYVRYEALPDQTTYDYTKVITAPGGALTISRTDLPPLKPGRYYFGLFNPINTSQTVVVSWTFGLDLAGVSPNLFTTNQVTQILDDAITTNSIYISATQKIASINVGVVLEHPRVSDLALTLISPTGQRVMLFEDRGGVGTTNLGHLNILTNTLPTVIPCTNGCALANTNFIGPVPTSGTLIIDYDMYTVPDTLDVYYDGVDIFSSGMVSGPGTFTIDYGPGNSTNIMIVMNQNGNPSQTQWVFTPTVVTYDTAYLTFTDNTNLANVPIKYAVPPYDLPGSGTNFSGDFELVTNGEYFAPTNIFDLAGGWTMTTNQILISTNSYTNRVSVVTDPATAQNGTNYLALGLGRLDRTITTTPGKKYRVNFAYRGPGINGWYRGEGDATDSADPESFGNNGSLIGRFQFPAGEVGQAFQLEDAGQQFRFAGTNTYVQIKQSVTLDVGTNGGFTVEGWINPTNLATQMPVVEWLARVPTNDILGSNIVIEAGPFLNPATGHYYYLLGSTNWTRSESWAQSLGGHLATVRTANEENWIYDNFSLFRGKNRALWIGLTNDPSTFTNFAWSSGETNITYHNWAAAQPTNCLLNNYTLILNPTNAQAGLWAMANNNGIFTCPVPNVTNFVYGIAEVPEIQTNGVQLWISVTNVPGTTNNLTPERGRLFANIVDTNNVSHVIYSAPGLLQSNVYQHVALTYSTNTGMAMLYLNGTNVAITNLGVFIPKTGGDVLLGKDMSRSITNNFFTGKLDEISIYGRFLSPTEIAAIYNLSFLTTNRLQGKFDPAVSPAQGLAKAQVTLSTRTNILYGQNASWLMNGFTFVATSNSLPFEITGLEPGMLIDSFGVSEAPAGNLYYFPEESLEALVGTYANGTGVPGDIGQWTLEIRDSRAGAGSTNAQLISWQLQMILITNTANAIQVGAQTPATNVIPPGQIGYFSVDVPAWANFATNILLFATNPVTGNAQPMDLLFNQTNPPTGIVGVDTFLINNQPAPPAVVGSPVLAATNTAPIGPSNPPLVPGNRYYLGVRNNGTEAALVGIEVDYNVTALTNGVPVTDVLNTNDTARYFYYDVSTNAWVSTFQLLRISGGGVDLVVRKGTPLPTVYNTDYGSFNGTNADETIYVLTNSLPVPLSAGRWYIGVIKRDANAVRYTVLAKEATYADTHNNIIDLTNRVPVSFTAGPGAALTNYFRFVVTNSPGFTLTNPPAGIHFELYNLTGNGDLTVQTNDIPIAPPFFQSSQRPGRVSELIYIQTNNVLTNLNNADWYLGVPNRDTNTISYTLVAVIDTNGFAAFPGAYGAGATTIGARFGTNVYHVTSLNDDGSPGTLRYGLNNATNATTFVFDLSGTIALASQLVITNSFLTIAGQSAPDGGITVQGNVAVQDAHDIVLRYLRFRSGSAVNTTNFVTTWAGGFEGPGGTTAGSYFGGGWYVSAGDIDLLHTGTFGSTAYEGTNYIDINGNSGPGTVQTNVATTVGSAYRLSFAYSQNPDGPKYGFPTSTVQLSQNGNTLMTLSTTLSGYVWTNLPWFTTSVIFTATSPTTQIQFASQNSGTYGVLLDAVKLDAVTTSAGDALRFDNVSDVVADHVSTSGSDSDNVSILNSTNVTLQWSVIANSLFNTDTNAGGSLLRYGYGALSFHHNLYANNASANPRLGDNLSLDFVNNVIYNWGFFAGFSADDTADNPTGFTNRLNYSCNYLIATTNSVFTNAAFWGGTTNTWIFQTNNLLDTNLNSVLDGVNYRWGMFTNQYTQFGHPFDLPLVPTDEAFIAYERVLDFAGAAMDKRGVVDQTIVWQVRGGVAASNSTPSLSGMVAWWPAEGNANDVVGGNNGTLVNGLGFAAGEVGQAFNFTNSNAYVTVPPSASLNVGVGNGFTIECWIKPDDISVQRPLVEWTYPGSVGTHFWISVPIGAGGPGSLYANIVDTANQSHWISSSSGFVQTNMFQHVAVTYDKTTGTAVLYYNGTAVATANLGIFTPQTSQTLLLGYRNSPTITYSGRLDEVSIYGRPLSSCEIASIYNAGSAGKQSLLATATALPFLDTDQDGVPDFWETTLGESPTNATASFTDRDGDGYTDLEEYLNWLGAPHALTVTNTTVAVNLYQLFGNTGNLLFGVTNPVNGSVVLTNLLGSCGNVIGSNTVALFTPTNDFGGGTNYGFASFGVMVTNLDTVAYFGPVTVSVFVSSAPASYLAGTLTNQAPQTNAVAANSVVWYQVNVPTNADWATNLLLFASTNVNLWFSSNLPPTTTTSSFELLTNVMTGSVAITTNSTPALVPGSTYYLGVENTNNFAVTYGVEVAFHLLGGSTNTNTNTPIITLLGGSGDLRGLGVKYLSNSLYIVGDDSLVGGLLGSYAIPLATSSVPLWKTNWPSANVNDHLYGVTANSNGVYAVGPNYTLTTDLAGGKEDKGITVKYPLAGPIGAGAGGDIWNQQTPAAPGAFSYGGGEGLNGVTLAGENGTNFVYATGSSQEDGANGGRFYISKLAEDSTVLWTRTDGTGAFAEPYSVGEAVTALNGYAFAAGVTNGHPYLRKYDPSGNLVWSRATTTNGVYFGICTYANFIFVVGGTGSGVNEDFLVDKWDENGNLLWSRSYDHGANQDQFNGAVIGNGHLFAVGATYGATAGGADAAVLEISPAAGDVISTNLIGGALDDIAHGVDTDNTNLFLIGESKSYSASNDLMLVQYPLTLPIPTNAVSSFNATVVTNGIQLQWNAPTNYQFSVQWSTNLVSPVVWNTFTNIVTSGSGTFTFVDDGSQSGGFGGMKFYRLVQYPYP